jgi:CYTH domain-containing protein
VQITGEVGHLVLASHCAKGLVEAAAEISMRQAEALLTLCAGRIEYLSIVIAIGSQGASIQRVIAPGPLDLISMAFRDHKTARKFQPPAWFGPEVSADASYRLRSIALAGQPAVPEVEVTNAALISLLDTLDHQDHEAEPRQTGRVQAAAPPEASFDAEAEQELDGLNIEDSVIRELARSLSPRRR